MIGWMAQRAGPGRKGLFLLQMNTTEQVDVSEMGRKNVFYSMALEACIWFLEDHHQQIVQDLCLRQFASRFFYFSAYSRGPWRKHECVGRPHLTPSLVSCELCDGHSFLGNNREFAVSQSPSLLSRNRWNRPQLGFASAEHSMALPRLEDGTRAG